MANTIQYYLASDAVIYPSSNAADEGKLNIEENVKSIVTRITNKNFVLHEGDYNISITSVSGKPCIAIASGEANIQGYHLITTSTLYLPAPEEAAYDLYIGLKLGKDGTGHVRGDVYSAGINQLEGVWASYFEFEDIKDDKEVLILGKVNWDGSVFSGLEPNEDLLTRITGNEIQVIVDDDKHPNITNITLQELVSYLPDWYISKLGDDIFGDLYFRIPGDTTNYGILGTLETNSHSKLVVKPNNSDSALYQAILGANTTHPYLQLADGLIDVTSGNMGLNASKNINMVSSSGSITSIAKLTNILKSLANNTQVEVGSGLVEFSSSLNSDIAGYEFASGSLSSFLGGLEVSYNTSSNLATITSDGNIQFNPYVILGGDARINSTLYLNGTSTYLNGTKWHLNNTYPFDVDNNGTLITAGTSTSVGNKVSGNYGNALLYQYGLNLTTTNSSYTPRVNFVSAGQSGTTTTLYKVSNENRLRTNGGFTADGTITASKVYNAVYNDYAEFYRKDKSKQYEPGDIIAIIPESNKYTLATKETRKMVVGVYSDTYGHILGGDELDNMEDNQENFIPVGVAGRVKVKVVGKLQVGDLVTMSEIDGVGCKSENPIEDMGCIIGKALQSKDSEDISKVEVQIMLV